MTFIPSEHIQSDTSVNVPMSFALERAVRLEAANQGVSKAELMRRVIIEYLNGLAQPQESPEMEVPQC